MGVGLAEPYPITWCAVEYFESTGAILHMLLCQLSPNSLHTGRSLLHHAIICNNEKAVNILLKNGADAEVVVQIKLQKKPMNTLFTWLHGLDRVTFFSA